MMPKADTSSETAASLVQDTTSSSTRGHLASSTSLRAMVDGAASSATDVELSSRGRYRQSYEPSNRRPIGDTLPSCGDKTMVFEMLEEDSEQMPTATWLDGIGVVQKQIGETRDGKMRINSVHDDTVPPSSLSVLDDTPPSRRVVPTSPPMDGYFAKLNDSILSRREHLNRRWISREPSDRTLSVVRMTGLGGMEREASLVSNGHLGGGCVRVGRVQNCCSTDLSQNSSSQFRGSSGSFSSVTMECSDFTKVSSLSRSDYMAFDDEEDKENSFFESSQRLSENRILGSSHRSQKNGRSLQNHVGSSQRLSRDSLIESSQRNSFLGASQTLSRDSLVEFSQRNSFLGASQRLSRDSLIESSQRNSSLGTSQRLSRDSLIETSQRNSFLGASQRLPENIEPSSRLVDEEHRRSLSRTSTLNPLRRKDDLFIPDMSGIEYLAGPAGRLQLSQISEYSTISPAVPTSRKRVAGRMEG